MMSNWKWPFSSRQVSPQHIEDCNKLAYKYDNQHDSVGTHFR